METTPRNAQQAMALALRHERAKAIITEGYTFMDMEGDGSTIAVCKPGRLAASYWMVDGECDCPDALKGNYCKHRAAWRILQDEQADEAAMWESICAAHDAEEGAHLDRIPTPTLMTLAVKDFIARLQADLQTTQTLISTQQTRRVGYIHCQQQHDRARRLQVLLDTLAEYNQVL